MKFSTNASILGLLVSSCNSQTHPPANPAAASYSVFSDPNEHAFSMDVPAGWNVRGGLFRRGTIDPRVMVEISSPDGKIFYHVGDARIPPFALPTPLGMRLGIREGMSAANGAMAAIVAHYRTGTQFSDLYIQSRYSKACRNIQVKKIQRAEPLMRVGMTSDDAGEIVFTCDGAEPMLGYVYAQSSLSSGPMGGVWGVPVIYGFLAPQAQARRAMEWLSHSVASYRENPQWTRMQGGLIQQTNAQTERDFQASLNQAQRQSQAINQSFDIVHRQQQRANSQLALSQDFNDIINGVTVTRDPTTGQTREVLTGAGSYYWVNGGGGVVNTFTNNQPGPNYHPAQVINRGR